MYTSGMEPSLHELAHRLFRGELRAEELTARCLARREARLGAYKAFDDERSLAIARAADAAFAAGISPGALSGIPISVKDLYGVPGYPTFAGSSERLPEQFEEPGPIVEALLSQLAVIVGKTHTVEFAFGGLGTNPHWPTPHNPWSKEPRVPGGSSAGAGVSLVEGSALLALGTDTAGSVRIPASFTGNVGLKTSFGRWSTDGVVPLSRSLDTTGLLARSVGDALWAFGALDPSWGEPEALLHELPELSASELTLGVPTRFFFDDCDAGVAEAVEQALATLEAAGARLIEMDLPEAEPAYALFREGGPVSVELHHFLATRLPGWLDTLDPNVRARLGDAAQLSAHEYLSRLELLAELASQAAARFDAVDAFVTPTVAITPPTFVELEAPAGYASKNLLSLRNTGVISYLGFCALSLPCGRDAAHMPVGLQIVLPSGDDERLLAVGSALEQLLGDGRAILGEYEAPAE
ncbi:MAG: amidase [Deltaproteobacteria bacterium]|nr:amidase [Deltaproteobacteria bacterium]